MEIVNLPVELLLQVFSCFSVEDLHHVMLVQRCWFDLIQEEQTLWKCWSHVHEWWFHRKMKADPKEECKISWKDLFIDSFTTERNWREHKYKVGVIAGEQNGEGVEIFHLQDNTLITNSYEGLLKVWNLDKLEFVRTFNNPDGEIVWFEFVDNLLASAHLVNTRVNLYDVRTGERTDSIDSSQYVNALCLSNDQLICGEHINIRVWDLNKHAELSCFSTFDDTNSGDIVLCGNENNIRAYDMRAPQPQALIQTITNWMDYFWYQWKTQTIYTPGAEGEIKSWDVRTKQQTHDFFAHLSPVTCGHMEDSKFVTCSEEQICVWDVSGEQGGRGFQYSIDTPKPIWGIATEERRMVGLNIINDIYVWNF